MKTQQRNFIVEIKSNGRRTAVRQGSIWGNTDLKAMARQAASVAPQLFETTKEAESVVAAVAPCLPDSPPIPQPDPTSDIGCDVQLSAPSKAVVVVSVPTTTASMDFFPETAAAPRGATGKANRPSKHGIERRAPDVPNGEDAPLAALAVDAPFDELAVLETENRRLRAAFAAFLRRQNLELSSMLERFDVS